MNISWKGFLFGLGVGAALAAVSFQLWALHVDRTVVAEGMPHVLHPLNPDGSSPELTGFPFTQFPRPWFPDMSHPVGANWRLTPLGGSSVTLASFRGKAVFLNFWSVSCGPCIAEMPGIEQLQTSLAGTPVEFVAVTNDGESTLREFLKSRRIRVPIFLSAGKIPAELDGPGVPVTFLLNGHGIAVFKHIGATNWDDDGARNQLRALASQ